MNRENKRTESQLSHLLALAINLEPDLFDEVIQVATRDELTGVYNASFQKAQLANELKRARLLNYPLAAMLFEIQPRESLDDTVRKMIEDKLMGAVADVLSTDLRATDWLARSGLHELTVVLPGCRQAHMEQMGREMLNSIDAIGLETYGDQEVHLQAWVGGAAFVRGYPDLDVFLSELDAALDSAKRLGPGQLFSRRIEPWARNESAA